MSLPYPYDPYGTAASNFIANEVHNVTPQLDPTQANFIVPHAAPYFLSSLIVRTGPANTDPALVEGVDYLATHHFIEASQSLNIRTYGSITFINRLYTGTLYLTYRTLGGPFTLDSTAIVTQLTQSLYSVLTVNWAQITGLPVAFPPVPHPHDTADLTGMAEVVAKLVELVSAVTAQGGNMNSLVNAFTQHLNNPLGAHTPAQIGLSHVANYAPATQADIDNGTPNKYMTTDMLVYAIRRYNLNGLP